MNLSISSALKPVTLVSLFALCAGASSVSLAATVEYVVVGKSVQYIQTSSTNVEVDPAPLSPTNGGPYGFSAGVMGLGMNSIPAPVISGPMTLPEPYFNGGTLVYNGSENAWRLGFPNADDWGSPDMGDLNAHFGSGVYTINVGGTSVPLNLTGGAYPNTPMVTLTGGVWSGGRYVVDPSQAVTITTNAFAAYGSNADGHMELGVNGIVNSEQFRSRTPSGTNFLTITVPANTLLSNQQYNAYAGFDAVVDLNPVVALPGSYNAAFYGVGTSFVISTSPVPVPAAAWLFGSGLLGLIGIARRKARAA